MNTVSFQTKPRMHNDACIHTADVDKLWPRYWFDDIKPSSMQLSCTDNEDIIRKAHH